MIQKLLTHFVRIDILYHIPKYNYLRQDQEKIFTLVHVSWDLYSFIFLLSLQLSLSLFLSLPPLYIVLISYIIHVSYIYGIYKISYYAFPFYLQFHPRSLDWSFQSPRGLFYLPKISHHRLLKPG